MLSTITHSSSSPSGLSGQRSAFARYCASVRPQYFAAWPMSSERTPPFDLKRIAEIAVLTSSTVSTPVMMIVVTPALS